MGGRSFPPQSVGLSPLEETVCADRALPTCPPGDRTQGKEKQGKLKCCVGGDGKAV